jgi:hypothetical protein
MSRKDNAIAYRAAVSYWYGVATFATLRGVNCLHSYGLRCSDVLFTVALRHVIW